MTDERVTKYQALWEEWDKRRDALWIHEPLINKLTLSARSARVDLAVLPWADYEALREKLIREGWEAFGASIRLPNDEYVPKYMTVDDYLKARGEG